MNRSKTIQIFLKDSDPDGIKIAELSNSISKVFVIPRDQLEYVKTRTELKEPALYLLFDDERSAVYIGECENFSNRVKDHESRKSFWHWAVVCVTNGSALDKADVKFLESFIVRKAIEVGRFEVKNRNAPNSNLLHEFKEAAIMDYFADVELLLSTLGFNVFEEIKEDQTAEKTDKEQPAKEEVREYDTIVSPCSGDGFKRAFEGESAWWAVRIGAETIPKLKYVSLYESSPVQAIRAYAKITSIEPYPDKPGKYKINHDGNIQYFDQPIKLGSNPNLSLQGSRYYKLSDMKVSSDLSELTDKAFGTRYSEDF